MSTAAPPKPIRFVNQHSAYPPTKRRRVNAACRTCRKRKTRCDGRRPLCSTCAENKQACLGYADDIEVASKRHNNDPDESHYCEQKDSSGTPPSPKHAEDLESYKATASKKSQECVLRESHRVPYFRYFGPTAIVPGYKAMFVAVPRTAVPTPAPSPASVGRPPSPAARCRMETPTYDPDPDTQIPVDRLIIHLVETFFLHLGCNYPFLKPLKFLKEVEKKRAEAILVNAVCALAARFSDHPLLTTSRDKTLSKPAYGAVFASRAKAAVVHTFPCPSVAAVQTCLLLAYEGFGSDEDSALWMYLGCAIRMAQDLGLQKLDRVKNQAKKNDNGKASFDETMVDETEKEHIDTLWAVFILDRVISSGTGRPVTLKDEEFELAFPEMTVDVDTGWPLPFPVLIQIIHLYGRVSDLINNIRTWKDMTPDKMAGLFQFEQKLTALYQKLDARLTFNAANFQQYVRFGQGTNFILVHFWFHALIMLLHQPTLLHSFEGRIQQLLPNSRELSMSSAKTVADILAFAELIDPRSFIGNPFTSQPMYIAASAFLMESIAHSSGRTSRDASPPKEVSSRRKHPQQAEETQRDKYSLLATAANQNYQRCYRALAQLETYWAGTKYILTALDQKAKGIWDPETYAPEEILPRSADRPASWTTMLPPVSAHIRGVPSPALDAPRSNIVDAGHALGWSLSGITNSPCSNLAFLYQPLGCHTSSGTLAYDPVRQPDGAFGLAATSLQQQHTYPPQRSPNPAAPPIPKTDAATTSEAEMLLHLTSPFAISPALAGVSQHHISYERSTAPRSARTSSAPAGGALYDFGGSGSVGGAESFARGADGGPGGYVAFRDDHDGMHGPVHGFGGVPAGSGLGTGLSDIVIANQEIDMSLLGGEIPWSQDFLPYLPPDLMGFFDVGGAA